MFVNYIPANGIVVGESGMFAAVDQVKLLYKAGKVLKVYNQTTGAVWQENVDWTFDQQQNAIVRTANSTMPYIGMELINPPDEKAIYYPNEGANAVPGRVGGGNVLFDAKSFFAENQIEIDYQVSEEQILDETLPDSSSGRLPRFRKKLAEGKAVRIIALGDSITEGYNCGKFIGFAPYRQPWFELFAEDIAQRFKVQCDWENRGINGASTAKPLVEKMELLDGQADLWVIAYGMNDLAQRSAEEFAGNLRKIMEKIMGNDPAAEFLLVTPMSGNPQWDHTPLESTVKFAQAIRQLPGDCENILLADVNKVWSKVLERKSFYDISGNGVNHPNDYSHTIYAAVLKNLF
ncbi:MAG: SGNH/GDSL hydrolase family protein [Lentisphaerae bacterium]|nr:SGNH/GDSL hydrolase family protein [Lentisphaerota bacterium]